MDAAVLPECVESARRVFLSIRYPTAINTVPCQLPYQARRPDDGTTCDPEIYHDINWRIRSRCDVVINNSTAGGVHGDMIAQSDNDQHLTTRSQCYRSYAATGAKEEIDGIEDGRFSTVTWTNMAAHPVRRSPV